jgi:TetR/AcrR family transcriptional repressor of nem operon
MLLASVADALPLEARLPYTQDHKLKTRRKIIVAARRLFNRRGFEAVSISEIMAEAGFTHGGFYKHFARKEDLNAEAVLEFIGKERPDHWERKHVDPSAEGPELARMILDAYLSDDHLRERAASCPMIALPSDVQRANPAVQRAFAQVLEMMAGAFAANLPAGDGTQRERALALVALAVGAMNLSRAVGDKRLAAEIRRSAQATAYRASGWELEPQQAVAAE